MKTHLPPQFRTPVLFALLAAAALAVGGATHGWTTVADVLPVPVVIVVGLFLMARRDSDAGALVRRQADERQASQRLRVQALVGRVLSLAVAIGYLIASNSSTPLWPWAALLGVMAASFLAGWLIYGEHRWRTPPHQ